MNNIGPSQSDMSLAEMQMRTPVKDLPPSLGFGSSSSPYFESPDTVERSSRNFNWPSEGLFKQDYAASTSHLLPSQFPPAFGTLESSPPEAGRSYGNIPSSDQSASPVPTKTKRRGRPRIHFVNEDLARQETATIAAQAPAVPVSQSGISQHHSQSSRQELHPVPSQTTRATGQRRASTSPLKPERSRVQKPQRKKSKLSDKASNGEVSVFTRVETTNGVPLFSSKIFELACKHQSNIRGAEACALRETLGQSRDSQCQFSTNGLGFNFSINMGGRVSIDATTQLTPAPSPYRGHHKSSSQQLDQNSFRDGSDSDSEAEISPEDSSTRTPPRFSSLGSCDAATAFAKSLARTNHRGQGFMFLFPPVSTPDKHGQLASFVPCTPRTPRAPATFDESSFRMQMQTPPGAIFSYETSGNLYSTGMTPYLGSIRGQS